MSKKLRTPSGLVYSTDPSIRIGVRPEAEARTLPPAQQSLRVRLETRQRAGKAMTVITGFIGCTADLEAVGKRLKAHCGTGGSAKDGEILIQGDQLDKTMRWLAKMGYAKAKRG